MTPLATGRPPRIVMVSWRDHEHPASGGAEAYTLHALRGLVRDGADVVWLTQSAPGLAPMIVIDGIEIVRRGRGPSHLAAAATYLRRHRRSIDLVIDQVNGYPMFTPFGFPGPRVVLIHQMAREVWFRHLPWPAALAGYLLEPLPLLLYRRDRTVTVSASTEASLRRLGFRDVVVVPNAVEPPPGHGGGVPREVPTPPTFVGLGRLVPAKRFDHLLQAFDRVRAERPDVRLVLIGRGEGRYARRLARRVAATPGAELLQDADEETKWRVLSRATALVATSVREGWGLMVSEAHAVGTPSIAYDVPGLRDSTENGVTGIVCAPRPAAAADAMLRLARDPGAWQAFSRAAAGTSDHRSPEHLGRAFADVVWEVLRTSRRGGSPGFLPPDHGDGLLD